MYIVLKKATLMILELKSVTATPKADFLLCLCMCIKFCIATVHSFCRNWCGRAAGHSVIRHLVLCWAGDHNGQCEVGKFIKFGKSGCRCCKTTSGCHILTVSFKLYQYLPLIFNSHMHVYVNNCTFSSSGRRLQGSGSSLINLCSNLGWYWIHEAHISHNVQYMWPQLIIASLPRFMSLWFQQLKAIVILVY